MAGLGCFREFSDHLEQIFGVHGRYRTCQAGGLFPTLWACSPGNAVSFLDVRRGKKLRIVLDHLSEDWWCITFINGSCNGAGYRHGTNHLQ